MSGLESRSKRGWTIPGGYINDWAYHGPLAGGATIIFSTTIGNDGIFQYNGDWYAWNAGNYKIEQVDVQCNEGSSDSYTTLVDFDIDSSTPDIVFTVVYYDTEFAALSFISSVSSFFESTVTHKVRIHDNEDQTLATYDNTGFSEMMGVSYVCLYRTGWDPPASYTRPQVQADVKEYAGIDLGLSSDWAGPSGGSLTNLDNHGFDFLVGLSGAALSETGGRAGIPGNNLIVKVKEGNGLNQTERILIHELSHTFGANGNYPDCEIYSVMNGAKNHIKYIEEKWLVFWDYIIDNDMTHTYRG